MPILLTPEASDECEYSEWSIIGGKREVLVEALAYLYLRQEENAQRVIKELAPERRVSKGRVVENVIRKLTAPDPKDLALAVTGSVEQKEKANNRIDVSVIHRDGLLFQHVSWIVARIDMPKGYMTSPHVRKADKGFDGFIIELDELETSVERVVLCEDKASIKPRDLVTRSVWPDITAIQGGERDDEILADLVTLLKSVHGIDAEAAVDELLWEEAREYRVAVATGENQRKDSSFQHIIAGFEATVGGGSNSRTAGILPFDDVRKGLAQLAAEVIEKVMETSGV